MQIDRHCFGWRLANEVSSCDKSTTMPSPIAHQLSCFLRLVAVLTLHRHASRHLLQLGLVTMDGSVDENMGKHLVETIRPHISQTAVLTGGHTPSQQQTGPAPAQHRTLSESSVLVARV